MKSTSTLLLSLAMAAQLHGAEPFTLSFDFDAASDFATGWNYEDAGMIHETADYFGAPDATGTNMVLGKASANMSEVIYTPMMNLAAGEPCTIDFDYWAPGGSAAIVYHVGLDITAGTAQEASAQTIATGTVPTGAAYSDWTHFSFSFTPENAGQYCFALKTRNYYNMTSNCGSFCIDNVVISGSAGEGGGDEGGGDQGGGDEGGGDTPSTGKEAFELEFNFDNNADYADGTIIAPGWGFEGGVLQRAKASDFGITSHSGDYVLGKATATFREMLFTPMMELVAGQPCTIEFHYLAPGGTPPMVRNIGLHIKAGSAQTSEAQTIEVGTVANQEYSSWTRQEFTFTPTVTGEYCFSIATFNPSFSSMCGGAYIDDVIISGYKPAETPENPGLTVDDLVPDEEHLTECQELPYIENFSDESHYDGVSYLPVGWYATGSVVWVTANMTALPAADGKYYMIADHSEYERDENAYTPFFNLEADKAYTISFKTFIQGNDYNEDEELTVPTLSITAGTEQDADFHATLLKLNERTADWTMHTVTFTPKVAGPYCFAFMLSGPANSGIVAVDQLTITAEGLVPRTEPAFSLIGVYDLMDSQLVTDQATPVQFVNRSRYAESYVWHAEGAVPETSTDENPQFTFPAAGEYNVTLDATNAKGTRSTSHSYNVKLLEENTGYAFHNLREGDDMILDRGAVPAFSTAADDYVTGFNHYYRTVAQRFELPKDTELSLNQLSCFVSDRRYAAIVEQEFNSQNTTPFSIVIYGSKEDGSIDPDNELGRHTTTIGEALGSSGLGSIGADGRTIDFTAPVKAKGTIYVAFEYSAELLTDPLDANLGRSYISTTAIRHGHGRTTLYALPYNVPEESEATVGEWCTVDKLDIKMTGIGAAWYLWATTGQSAIALTPDGETAFCVTCTGNDIIVSGTKAGSTVSISDIQGRLLVSAKATEGSTAIPASALGHGMFIVSCPEGTAKIVK